MNLTSSLYRLGWWSVRRRRSLVALWIIAVAMAFAGGRALEPTLVDDLTIPGSESLRALELLEQRFPGASGATATVVFHEEDGFTTSETAAVERAVREAASTPGVLAVETPSGEGHNPTARRAGRSADGTTAFATVQYEAEAGELGTGAVDALQAAVEPARAAGVRVELGGPLVETTAHPEPEASEAIGLLAAVVVLLLAFGSVVAMGLPIATALLGLGGGLAAVAATAAFVDMPTVAPTLTTMLALGVGIDYALFIVTRYRENLAKGTAVEDAIGRALATSGAAVVFAGGTVVIAILGLWILGIPFVGLLGTAAALGVAIAVLAAITLLPALLGFAGRSIDRLGVPRRRNRSNESYQRGWARFARHVTDRPWSHVALSSAILVGLSLPVLSMHLGQVDAGAAPDGTTHREVYDLLSEGFGPGFNGPLLLSVELGTERDRAPLERIADGLRADPGVARVTEPIVGPDGRTAVLTAVPTSAPQDEATTDLVHRLRDETIPDAVAGTEARAYVGGPTASQIDLADRVGQRLPWFIGAVVLVSFLLLMVVFRSLLVPLKAALLNLLAIGAAYGVVVAVFQWGWLKGLVGLEETVPIVAFVPMMMFAILFGLSMDYEVFLLSRVREEYLVDRDNRRSIVAGVTTTARVITSAALIMISVFVAFLLNDNTTVKMVGLGLATAVFVDATLVRTILVPATMVLVGDANWWLPRWLDRLLPNLDIEGEVGLSTPEPDPAHAPDVVGAAVSGV